MNQTKTIIICSSLTTTVGNHYVEILKIFVHYFGWNAIFISDIELQDIEFKNSNTQFLAWPNKTAKDLKAGIFLSRLLYKTKPTIVISNFSSSFYCTILSKIFGVKRILNHYHTPSSQLKSDWQEPKYHNRLIRRLILKLNSEIIASSEFIKNDLINYWGVKKEKILEIPFLLNQKHLLKNSPPRKPNKVNLNETVTFFYPGRLHKSKGHIEFIENIFIPLFYKNSNVVLIINGKGPLHGEIKQIIETHNLGKVILFQEPTSYSDYLQNIQSATFCCGLSEVEGFGLVFLEMLAMGSIPISRNISPMNEFIPDHLGILLQDQNYQEIIDKVSFLINDKESYNLRRKNTKTYFKNNYDISTQGVKYARLIKGIDS